MKILVAGVFIALKTYLLFLLEYITHTRSQAFQNAYFDSFYGMSTTSKRELETIFILTYQVFITYYVSGNILSILQRLTNLILITTARGGFCHYSHLRQREVSYIAQVT